MRIIIKDTFRVEFTIPWKLRCRFIGRGGEIVKSINEEFRVKIKTEARGTKLLLVRVYGYHKTAVHNAESRIMELVVTFSDFLASSVSYISRKTCTACFFSKENANGMIYWISHYS